MIIKTLEMKLCGVIEELVTQKKILEKGMTLFIDIPKEIDYIFNVDNVREEYAHATKERFKHYIGNKRKGIDFGEQSLNPKGKHPDDWWQIQPIAPSRKE